MMNRDIKALETIYKGHKFRSRLEARWAIFFDGMGWEWWYEPEAVETRHGGYLIDFYLPAFRVYAEVKPGPFSEVEIEKCIDASIKLHRPVLCLAGMPSDHSAYYQIWVSPQEIKLEAVWDDELKCFIHPYATVTGTADDASASLKVLYDAGDWKNEDRSRLYYVEAWPGFGKSSCTYAVPLCEIDCIDAVDLRHSEGDGLSFAKSNWKAVQAARTARFDNGLLSYTG